MTVTELNREMLSFIDRSPTAYQVVENMVSELEKAGFEELSARSEWKPVPGGKYYTTRNGSSLIAFIVPENDFSSFLIAAAHTDSPGYKIKENCAVQTAGVYSSLNTESYGGMLCSTWMDRPLSAAGRIVYRENGKLIFRNVNIDRDLAVIPNVAIHMDRSANDGKEFNHAVDMLPLIGLADMKKSFNEIAAEAAGVDPDSITAKDMFLYPRIKGIVWGSEDEFISSPRIDDQQCVWGCMKGFLTAENGGACSVLCAFDNEEVGSGTKQGADSEFLSDALSRICAAFGKSAPAVLAGSFMVSADNAHAVHPNHPEHADRNDRPVINGGVVIKYNANQRYASDAVSASVFSEICVRAKVPTQTYTNRADKAGGSTLGHISTSHVSVPTVDIGMAQLAMHSSWETAGARDTAYLVRAMQAYYSSCPVITENGAEF